jgi:hypothetical protein
MRSDFVPGALATAGEIARMHELTRDVRRKEKDEAGGDRKMIFGGFDTVGLDRYIHPFPNRRPLQTSRWSEAEFLVAKR